MKEITCCANCGTLGKNYVQNQCPRCGYLGHTLPKINLAGFEDLSLFIELERYSSNNTKCAVIYSVEEGELENFIEISTNLEGSENFLSADEILIKTWAENESLIAPLLQSGYFEDTGRCLKVSQWCTASVWKIVKTIPENIQPSFLKEGE